MNFWGKETGFLAASLFVNKYFLKKTGFWEFYQYG